MLRSSPTTCLCERGIDGLRPRVVVQLARRDAVHQRGFARLRDPARLVHPDEPPRLIHHHRHRRVRQAFLLGVRVDDELLPVQRRGHRDRRRGHLDRARLTLLDG